MRLFPTVALLALLASPDLAQAQDRSQTLPPGWGHVQQGDWPFDGVFHDGQWLMFSRIEVDADGIQRYGDFRFEVAAEGRHRSIRVDAVALCAEGTMFIGNHTTFAQPNLTGHDWPTAYSGVGPPKPGTQAELMFKRLCGLPLTP